MKEQLLMKFKLPMIQSLAVVNAIVTMGYKATGNKFTVSFNGSKGYLNDITIECEGNQIADNRIRYQELLNKDGSLKSIDVNVFYSNEHGVRISTGKDEPRVISE